MNSILSNPNLQKNINLKEDDIRSFCQKWSIKDFYFFGSVVTENFSKEKSDIDIMVDFKENTDWSLFDHFHMVEELEAVFKRKVDLLTKRAVEKSKNPYRKKNILDGVLLAYHE